MRPSFASFRWIVGPTPGSVSRPSSSRSGRGERGSRGHRSGGSRPAKAGWRPVAVIVFGTERRSVSPPVRTAGRERQFAGRFGRVRRLGRVRRVSGGSARSAGWPRSGVTGASHRDRRLSRARGLRSRCSRGSSSPRSEPSAPSDEAFSVAGASAPPCRRRTVGRGLDQTRRSAGAARSRRRRALPRRELRGATDAFAARRDRARARAARRAAPPARIAAPTPIAATFATGADGVAARRYRTGGRTARWARAPAAPR